MAAIVQIAVEFPDPEIRIVQVTFGGASLNRVPVPASASAAGNVNDFADDGDYFYLCVAASTWRRFPLNEWS